MQLPARDDANFSETQIQAVAFCQSKVIFIVSEYFSSPEESVREECSFGDWHFEVCVWGREVSEERRFVCKRIFISRGADGGGDQKRFEALGRLTEVDLRKALKGIATHMTLKTSHHFLEWEQTREAKKRPVRLANAKYKTFPLLV